MLEVELFYSGLRSSPIPTRGLPLDFQALSWINSGLHSEGTVSQETAVPRLADATDLD